MDTDGKTNNSTGTTPASLKRLTPSELRERLLYEQEARIGELIKHNSELVKAMDRDREQLRLHAETNARTLALLEAAIKQQPTAISSSPTLSSITSAAGNLIAIAVISASSFVPAIVKFLSTSNFPVVTVMLRTEWGVLGLVLAIYLVWTLLATKTNNANDYAFKTFLGVIWLVGFVFQFWASYLTYRYHSLNTSWISDFVIIVVSVLPIYAAYINLRSAWKIWRTNKKPAFTR